MLLGGVGVDISAQSRQVAGSQLHFEGKTRQHDKKVLFIAGPGRIAVPGRCDEDIHRFVGYFALKRAEFDHRALTGAAIR